MGESNRDEIAKLEALYANNPGGRVFTHLAEAYRKAGELDRARKILEDGLVRHADSASAHVVLGRVLLDQGGTAEASSAFRRVLELDPENRVALRTLGDLNRKSGGRDEALEYYRKLQALDPGDDDLGQLITKLASEPEAETTPEVPAAAAEEPAAAAAAEPEATPEPEPVSAAAPESAVPAEPEEHAEPAEPAEPAQPAHAGADFALDWTAAEPETAEALPGDLAQFAEESQAAAAEETAEVEQPFLAVQSSFEASVESNDPSAEAQPASGQVPATEPSAEPWAEAEKQEPEAEPWAEPRAEMKDPWASPEPSETPEPAEPAEPAFETAAAETPEEPWSELPSTFEEPEPWTPSVELTQEDLEPWQAEPWTESVDLTAGTTREEPVESSFDPDALGPMDLSVDPSAEEAREASFEEMLSSNQTKEATPVSDEDLPTETLAELYRTQGFYDRAREVYKALLEARPDDVRLQARLREVESLERGEPVGPDTAGAGAESDDEAREAWMAGVASAWTGEHTVEVGAPSLYSWTDEPAEGANGVGPTLREYLNRLLSWRPAGTGGETNTVSANANLAVEPEAPKSEAPKTEAEPDIEHILDIQHDIPVLTLDEEVPSEKDLAVSLMEWQAPATEEPAETTEAVVEPEPQLPEIATEPEAPAPPPPAPSPVRAATTNPVEDAFDEWFNDGSGSTAPAQPAQTVESASDQGTAGKRAEESAAAQATMSEPAESVDESAPTAEESDDDLEMFRSWLQSLKR